MSRSPRSGRNERSEWRTARRAVDRRGSAAPFIAEQPAQSRLYGRRPATEQAFRFTWLGLGHVPEIRMASMDSRYLRRSTIIRRVASMLSRVLQKRVEVLLPSSALVRFTGIR